jgi:hypothetical protein
VAVPDQFSAAEDRLAHIVEDLTVSDTRRALGYWRQSVDGPGTKLNVLEEQEMRGISRHLRPWGGMVRIDGWMTHLAGQALISALEALIPPPGDDDTRTPRQRRHDAPEDLARHYLESPDAGGLHETEGGRLLTIAELRTISCDCWLSRIVLGPDSEIIEVGRRTRIIPTPLRRAVITRDRHCTWPGSDRNPRRCDIHHIQHRANGGATQPAHLRLLCRYHHSRIHQETESGPDPHTESSRPPIRVRPVSDRPGGATAR